MSDQITPQITAQSDNPPRDLHLQILSWAVERHMDFDFAHFKKNMAPDEYEQYKKTVVRDAIRAIVKITKQ